MLCFDEEQIASCACANYRHNLLRYIAISIACILSEKLCGPKTLYASIKLYMNVN